ncbi:MAG: preprotein translocase subunit SecE [Oscillospiraceae bacterium]|nr:preprotein translocase subunit SecE [Oscillospiraceae bacterium]
MAEKTGSKQPGKIKAFFGGIAKYFRDTKSEMKKVSWPSKKQVINNTIVVCVVVLISAVAILALDALFGAAVGLLIGA